MENKKIDRNSEELSTETLAGVSGGDGCGDSGGYIFNVGDRVRSWMNPENGVGTVTSHVGVQGNFTIDAVYFDDISTTYNCYENHLEYA